MNNIYIGSLTTIYIYIYIYIYRERERERERGEISPGGTCIYIYSRIGSSTWNLNRTGNPTFLYRKRWFCLLRKKKLIHL
jgi:hypothetical protein